MLQGNVLGSDLHSGRVTWVRVSDVERPETPNGMCPAHLHDVSFNFWYLCKPLDQKN